MTWLNVEFAQPKVGLHPGDALVGEAIWTLSEPAESLRLKLMWRTEGEGVDPEPVTVEAQTIEQPATEGRRAFTFTLPTPSLSQRNLPLPVWPGPPSLASSGFSPAPSLSAAPAPTVSSAPI